MVAPRLSTFHFATHFATHFVHMSFPTATEIREAAIAEKKIELNLPPGTDPKLAKFFADVQIAASRGVWACVWGDLETFPEEMKNKLTILRFYIFKIDCEVDVETWPSRTETKVVISWDPTLRDYDFRGEIAGIDGDAWWITGFV